MRRPAPTRGRGAVVCTALAVLLLQGCGPVELPTPDLSDEDAAACADLVEALPEVLVGHEAVETEPEGAPGAAWGDPPIVLSCGGPEGEGFGPVSECIRANDVDWYVPSEQEADQEADLTITLVDHEPRLLLEVPADYRPDDVAAVLAELAAPVKQHLRRTEPCL